MATIMSIATGRRHEPRHQQSTACFDFSPIVLQNCKRKFPKLIVPEEESGDGGTYSLSTTGIFCR